MKKKRLARQQAQAEKQALLIAEAEASKASRQAIPTIATFLLLIARHAGGRA